MDQVFSKETEMVYVLRKHPDQSDSLVPADFIILIHVFNVEYS